MMVEFCRQSSNVLYLIIHLYVWILILQNATWSLWAIVFLTTIAAFCTLFAAVEAILSHFVKFFKNHTVFYMAQLLLALIFVILFDTQFFSLQVLSRCHQEFGLLVPNCQLNTMSSVQDVIHYYTTAKPKDTRTFKSIDMDKLPPNLVMGGKVPFKTVSSWQSVIPSKNNKCSDPNIREGNRWPVCRIHFSCWVCSLRASPPLWPLTWV